MSTSSTSVLITHKSPTYSKPKAPADEDDHTTPKDEIVTHQADITKPSPPHQLSSPLIRKRSPKPPLDKDGEFPQSVISTQQPSQGQTQIIEKPQALQDYSPKSLSQARKPTPRKPCASTPEVTDKPATAAKPWTRKGPESFEDETFTPVKEKQANAEETEEQSRLSLMEKPVKKFQERTKPTVKPRHQRKLAEGDQSPKKDEASELLERGKSMKKKLSEEKIRPSIKPRTRKLNKSCKSGYMKNEPHHDKQIKELERDKPFPPTHAESSPVKNPQQTTPEAQQKDDCRSISPDSEDEPVLVNEKPPSTSPDKPPTSVRPTTQPVPPPIQPRTRMLSPKSQEGSPTLPPLPKPSHVLPKPAPRYALLIFLGEVIDSHYYACKYVLTS